MPNPFDQFDAVPQANPFDKFDEATAPLQSSGLRRAVADPAISLARGIVGVPEALVGLADIPTMGGAGKAAEALGFRPREAKEFLGEFYSPEYKQTQKELQETQGFFPTIQKAIEKPSIIAHGLIESLPSIGAGGAIARGALAAAPRLGFARAGAIGEGAVSAGATAEEVRQRSETGWITPWQSATTAISGAVTGGVTLAGAKIAQRFGLLDVEQILAGKAIGQATGKRAVRRVAEGFATQGAEELLQSAQEQIAQNIALGEELGMGVGQAAALGMLTGGLLGGGMQLARGQKPTAKGEPPAPEATPVAEAPTGPAVPEPMGLSEFIRANREEGVTGPITATEVKAARPEYEAYKQAFINEQFGVQPLTPEQRNQLIINQTPTEVPGAAPVEPVAAPVQKTRMAEPTIIGEQPAPAPAAPIITAKEAELLRIAEKETGYAPDQVKVQGGVQLERGEGAVGGQAAAASAGDRVFGAAKGQEGRAPSVKKADPIILRRRADAYYAAADDALNNGDKARGLELAKKADALWKQADALEAEGNKARDTQVALLKRQRGELLSNREAKLVRDYEKTAPAVDISPVQTTPRFRGRQFGSAERRENFVNAYTRAVDTALADLTAQGVVATPNKLRRAASLLKRSAEAAVMAKDDTAGAAILDEAMGKALRGIIPKAEIETFRQKLADATQAVMPETLSSRAAVDEVIAAKAANIRNTLAGMIGTPKDVLVETPERVAGGAGMIQFGELRDIIAVSLQASDEGSVAAHEGYHYLERRKLTGPERRVVRQAFASGSRLHRVLVAKAEAYDAANGTDITSEIRAIPAEARAYGFEFWRRGELEAQGMIAKVFQKLARVMERIRNYVDGLGFTSYEDIFAMIRRGEYAKRDLSGIREFEREVMRSRAQREASEQAFYSALGEAIADIKKVAGKDGMIAPAQAKAWLAARQKEGRFKAAELEAVGLAEWLDLQQGKVSVADIEAFVREHGVKVEEVMLGGQGPVAAFTETGRKSEAGVTTELRYQTDDGRRIDADRDLDETEWTVLLMRPDGRTVEQNIGLSVEADSITSEDDVTAAIRKYFEQENTGDPKFAQWQLPGGENYRELALSLPRSTPAEVEFNVYGAFPSGPYKTYEAAQGYIDGITTRGSGEPGIVESIKKFPFRIEQTQTDASRAQEFRVPREHEMGGKADVNRLAHVRFNERTDADGKRVLFIEELQSDWAQKGRKEGFANQAAKEEIANLLKRYDVLNNARNRELTAARDTKDEGAIFVAHVDRAAELAKQLDSLQERMDTLRTASKSIIPSAPFVTDTKAWVALALKRMIRYAAENGFDRVAWTTGEQQATRYDLSKHVREIEVHPNSDSTYDLTLTMPDGATQQLRNIAENALEDNVGKDLAKKIIEDSARWVVANKEYRDALKKTDVPEAQLDALRAAREAVDLTYSGLDLKVGGEGMKAFYDKIVPQVANEVLKKFGGGKVDVRLIEEGTDYPSTDVRHGTEPDLVQPGFDITPALKGEAMAGLPLFSKAATESIQDIGRRFSEGDLQREQVNAHLAGRLDTPDMRDLTDRLAEKAGFELKALGDSIRRMYHGYIGSGLNRARASQGYANVFGVMTHFIQRKASIFERAIAKDLSTWVKGAPWSKQARADKTIAFGAMLKATVKGLDHDSAEYHDLMKPLTQEQRAMVDQAWAMIGKMLDAEFVAEMKQRHKLLVDTRGLSAWVAAAPEDQATVRAGLRAAALAEDSSAVRAGLTPQQAAMFDQAWAISAAFNEWVATRKAQVEHLKKHSYVPERRYGDYFVHAYVEAPDGKKITVYYEQYERPAAALEAEAEFKDIFGKEGLKVEQGYKHKVDYDGSVSIGQFLDLAQRHGIALTQAEKERLGKALIAADSTRRNRLFRRQNVAGYSQDGMRVLAEFAVSMSNKIAYAEMGDALQDSLQGRQVDVAFTKDGTVTINTQANTNLWQLDGPDAGFFRNLADEKVGFVMSPESRSTVSNKLRAMATVYFLGGSVAAAGVNLSSLPMITLPWLTQHTNAAKATATLLEAMRIAGANFNAIRDLPTLLGTTPIEGVDNVEGLRHALQIGAQDGSLFDTEQYQFMGLSRGQEYSLSGRTQEAVKLWMTPFRLAEQYNRVSAFIAAYKVAKSNKLDNEAAHKQAQEAVFGTQFRYDEANRPALADSGVGSLFFVFKSFPIFMMETMTFLAKTNPKSAVFMLGMLVLMAGVEGLPFAEDLEDLIDVLAQRLFNEPFNSKRWLRNTLKSASEAVVGADLSGVLMHGVANSLTGLNFASRVGAGNLIPGTRIGAADVDYRRAMDEILGPVGGMVTGIVGGADALSKGDFLEAAKKGLPLAAKNAVKGWEQFEKGYATDAGGRKLVDVGSWEAFWQSVGFSSSALSQVYESDTIDRRTVAFYNDIRTQFTKEMVSAIRDGDRAAAQEIGQAIMAWNQAHPDMPVAMSPASLRRQVALAGMPLNQRTLLTMPKYLRGQSEAAIGLAAE